MGKVNISSASHHKGHSIMCIGGCHERGCKTTVHGDIFRQNFVVSDFLEPGACTGTLSSTADSDLTHLTKKEYINFQGRFQ